MAYKFSKGDRGFGDIKFEDDSDTGFDFEDNYIGFDTDGSTSMVLSGSRLGIGTTNPDYRLQVAGNIGVNQYIYHNGDANTWINFTDNRIRLNAGGNNFIDCEDPGSAPHKVRINNGGNNIDFVIKDNSGNVYFTADASTARIGIGAATDPSTLLHLDGTDPTITFSEQGSERATIGVNSSDNILVENKTMNKFIVFKTNDAGTIREGLRLGGVTPEVVVNEGSDSLIDFRVESNNNTHMLFVDGGNERVGIGISVPETTLHIHADSINNGAVTISQSDNSGDASQLDLMKSRGSGASPATVQSNDFLGQVRFLAYDGNSYDNFADIYVQASNTISTSSHPTKMVIRTTRENATSPTTALTIDETQNVKAEGNLEANEALIIRNDVTPSSASDFGMKGEIRWDSNYIYVCVATDTWKRVALSTW